jgi:uncharacterized membrane protein (UPF0127 family)
LVIAVLVVVALVAAYAVYQSSNEPGAVTSPVPSKFTVTGRTYSFTYIAINNEERREGLMNKDITNTTAMLFAFPSSSQWQFWMYDTKTSLDIIWVNATGDSGRVVYEVTSAQPCYNAYGIGCATYAPTEPSNYVIEAKAGFAAANGILVGTAIQFS